jgi:hypothetical protein
MMASGNANQIFINQSILAMEMVRSVKFSSFSLKNIKACQLRQILNGKNPVYIEAFHSPELHSCDQPFFFCSP